MPPYLADPRTVELVGSVTETWAGSWDRRGGSGHAGAEPVGIVATTPVSWAGSCWCGGHR